MTRLATIAVLTLAATAQSSPAAAQQPRALNPVGTYSVSSATDTGQPLAGSLVITATAEGNYAGNFTSPALPGPIPLLSVATNGKQMLATLQNPDGILLVWIEFAADGTFKGTWHQLGPGFAATGKKEK